MKIYTQTNQIQYVHVIHVHMYTNSEQMYTCMCMCIPLLLYVVECHTVSVFKEELPSTSKEDGVTGRSLHLLGDFVLEVLDHQLHVHVPQCGGGREGGSR